MKLLVPSYTRINRVIRDIPSWQIQGGSKISNMRQYLKTKMEKEGLKCQCIRCREIKSEQFKLKDLKLKRQEYTASSGQEIFLSFCLEKQDKLAAFLRLRMLIDNNKKLLQQKILKNSAIIREVHTYGQLVPLNQKKEKAVQHLGLGKRLIKEAEKIAQKAGYKKIAVIAGIGVRPYYRKLGYHLQNTYMTKKLP